MLLKVYLDIILRAKVNESKKKYRNQTNICFSKVNNRNTGKRCEICLKLTIKTHFTPFSSAFIVDFEQVNFSWELMT